MLSALVTLAAWLAPALLLGLGLMAGALWILRRHRRCPSCGDPMRPVDLSPADRPAPARAGVRSDGRETPTYEVLVCEPCANTATLVHGQKSRFAYCPACTNRSLRAPALLRPDGTLEIHEECELCGYRSTAHLPIGASRPAGQVIPFPIERARRPRRADDA